MGEIGKAAILQGFLVLFLLIHNGRTHAQLYAGGSLLGNTVDDNVGASQNQQQCDDSTTSDAYSPNTPTTAADGRYHTTTAAFVGGNDKQTADAAFALET